MRESGKEGKDTREIINGFYYYYLLVSGNYYPAPGHVKIIWTFFFGVARFCIMYGSEL